MVVGLHFLRRSYFLPLTKKRKETVLCLPRKERACRTLRLGTLASPLPRLPSKPLKTYPPLSELRRSPPPPLAPPRAQELPTLPPKPPEALPKAEEDKKFFEQRNFQNRRVHNMLLRENPLRGGLTQARKEAKR